MNTLREDEDIDTKKNPFFEPYDTPFEAPPFDRIEKAHYEPAFDEAIRVLAEEVQEIVCNGTPATFENTIVALERSGRMLDRVSAAFFNILNADADDEMMEISQRISPKLSESANNIYLNEELFARVKEVYGQREQLLLSSEDARLLEETYESFSRKGADLGTEEKVRYRKLSEELGLLCLTFEQHALKDKNRYELLLAEDDLEGLPESIREAASARAAEKGKQGWLFDLSAPSYVPFMRYSARRDLREKMYGAYLSIGNKDDVYDNKEVVRRILAIRLEIARMMGYRTYAEYKLKRTMAKTPERVYQLLDNLLAAYKPVAEREYDTLFGFVAGFERKEPELKPWDWNYYSEKLKDIRFKINDEMTRPYFELNHVRECVFGLATQLYGITFRVNKNIPVYHTEVETYEVYDADGRFLAVLYTDFFPRDGKQSGAWMNGIREQYRDGMGTDHRPLIIIVMNFSRPVGEKPSLLTFDEVKTFLHEFGHALHGIFSDGKYAGLSGTNVFRDFVELPSQLMENWLTEKEFLDQIAIHYQTGERIPEEWVRSLIDASRFQVGYACCRQLSFGYLDMAWHTLEEPFAGDMVGFEKNAWKKAVLLPDIAGTWMSGSFGHIFSGGYAAGYYGYKWAEVLDADAFSVFREKGLFDRETAAAFREHILSKGGTEDPDMLYRRFRGGEPQIEALLMRDGIKKR